MDKLRAYLNSMTPARQAEFARRCGTTIGYLRKAISAGQQLGESICINIDRESGGAVRCEELAPGVDWGYLRTSAESIAASTPTNGVADRIKASDDTQPPVGGSNDGSKFATAGA